MVGVAVEKSVKSMFESGNLPDDVAFFSDSSNSAKSCSSDFLLAFAGAGVNAGMADARGASGAGATGVGATAGAATVGVAIGAGVGAGSAATGGFAMVIPSSTKSSAPCSIGADAAAFSTAGAASEKSDFAATAAVAAVAAMAAAAGAVTEEAAVASFEGVDAALVAMV